MDDKITYQKVINELKTLPPREKQSTEQRKFFSEFSSALLTAHLKHLIENRDWFAGILMSASMLDFAGKTRLLWKHTAVSQSESRKIYNLKFAETNKQLLKHKIIDKSTYDEIDRIREARNEAAHDIPYQVGLSLMKKPNATLESYIKQTIDIIELLFSSTN